MEGSGTRLKQDFPNIGSTHYTLDKNSSLCLKECNGLSSCNGYLF